MVFAEALTEYLINGLSEALGILDRDVLGAPVAVMDQFVALCGAPGVQCLLQRVEDELDLH